MTRFDVTNQHTTQGVFQGQAAARGDRRPRRRLRCRAVKSDETYRTPRHNRNAMELHAATVGWVDGAWRPPVCIVLSREGVCRVGGGCAPTEQRVAPGAQADGRLDALMHAGTAAMTSHKALPEPFILPTQSGYATRTMRPDVQVATVDMVANTFMRAPGELAGRFALDSANDEMVDRFGMA